MVLDSKSQKSQKKQKHSKKKYTFQSRNQNDLEDFSSNSQDPKADSKAKDKLMQCYYYCKHGYKAIDYKLRERAKKIHKQKDNQKKGFKDDAAANVAIATFTPKPANEATIADARLWACYTNAPIAKDQDLLF